MNKEIKVELKTPVELAIGGDFKNISEVSISCATQKQIADNGAVMSFFYKARNKFLATIMDAITEEDRANASSAETHQPTSAEILEILLGNLTPKDLEHLYMSAERLFTKGCLKVDGDVLVDGSMYAKLSVQDINTCVGEYIANFM